VSGFGGTIAIVVTWSAVVAILLSMFVIAEIRAGREKAGRHDDRNTQRVTRIGHDIVGFFQEREADAPPASSNSMLGFKGGAEGREQRSRGSYDAETMRIYHQRFAEGVGDACHDLRTAGQIGTSEFRTLISPREPDDLENVGRRLIELGYPEE
jgi:hypothetical protein